MKLAMEKRRQQHGKRRRRRVATDRTTFLSGFESTDEEEDEDGNQEESEDDRMSQASGSASECPSRADGQDSHSELSTPSHADLSPSSTSAPFDALVHSLASHPSIQQINSHLNHLSTILTLEAAQPLQPAQPVTPASPTTPSYQPSSASDFNRTGASDSSALYERSTELEAVMEVRVQLQRERARRSRSMVGQLRQLVQLQSAEMTAMRNELDTLRSATYDSYNSSMGRETRQVQEWMAALAERPASDYSSRRTSTTAQDSRTQATSSAPWDVSRVCDVQQVCGLLDGVMRHVHDSGVRSQSYVEDVKRLCQQHASRQQSSAVDFIAS